MLEFSRIIKECFWDIDINENDIVVIVNGNNFRKKQFIFEKILLNSTRIFHDLELFDEIELKKLLLDLKVSQFNKEHVLRRKNLVEVYFFDAAVLIDELKWVS